MGHRFYKGDIVVLVNASRNEYETRNDNPSYKDKLGQKYRVVDDYSGGNLIYVRSLSTGDAESMFPWRLKLETLESEAEEL